MADSVLVALCGEQIRHSNSMATVTANCIVINNSSGESKTIVSLSRVLGVNRNKTSYPALLVISCGLFLLAAAAAYSPEGTDAALPMAILGMLFVFGYTASRKASVVFSIDSGRPIETVQGSVTEAAALVSAVELARMRFHAQQNLDHSAKTSDALT